MFGGAVVGDALMATPRFGFIQAKKGAWEVVKISTGPWMLYADHAHALAEKDAEIAKWKAAHDEMVARNSLLRDRPDLQADRICTHDEWVQKLAEREQEIDCLSEQVNVLNKKCCLMEDELDIDVPVQEKAFVVDLQRRLRLGCQFTKRDCVRVLKLLRRKAEKERAIQQIREHEFQRGFHEGAAAQEKF